MADEQAPDLGDLPPLGDLGDLPPIDGMDALALDMPPVLDENGQPLPPLDPMDPSLLDPSLMDPSLMDPFLMDPSLMDPSLMPPIDGAPALGDAPPQPSMKVDRGGSAMPMTDENGNAVGMGSSPTADDGGSGGMFGGLGAADLPTRQYLDTTIIPVLRLGLRELVKQRPADPYNFLADYIRDNKPSS